MKCLIIVDYQVDFVTGSLGFPGALRLERTIAKKIDQYHNAGDCVVFTMDSHGQQYPGTRQGKAIRVQHCRTGTPGFALYGLAAQKKRSEDLIFEKSAYGSPALFDWLRQQKFDMLEIGGVVTNVCVLSNAVLAQAALPEVPIYIDPDCVAAPDLQLHRAALSVLEGLQIHVTRRCGSA